MIVRLKETLKQLRENTNRKRKMIINENTEVLYVTQIKYQSEINLIARVNTNHRKCVRAVITAMNCHTLLLP